MSIKDNKKGFILCVLLKQKGRNSKTQLRGVKDHFKRLWLLNFLLHLICFFRWEKQKDLC